MSLLLFPLGILRWVWRVTVVVTPLLAVWFASSLVAYFGGHRALALVGGVVLFPVLPLVWHLQSRSRYLAKVALAKQQNRVLPRRRIGAVDRFALRTLTLSALFIGLMLAWFPKPAFTALATRGDWFLEGKSGVGVTLLRTGLLATASGLEGLHKLANPNPYAHGDDVTTVPDTVQPVVETHGGSITAPAWIVGETTWPRPAVVHPAIVNMPASAEESIESVAAWVRAHESDPFERIKALHDWEVTRLHYDTASLDPKARKSQDASTVFQNRMGVCEGYARLLVALAKLTGDEVVYVVGEARDDDGNAMANGHAWNAAHIRGAWYFIDVTWDDPVDQNGQRKDTYSTDYLFTPPSIALLDHLPDDARWQLTSSPITRVAFVRQPMTRPGFAKYGLHLVTPNGPLVDAHDTVDVVIDNPRAQHVMVSLAAHDDSSTSAGINCTSSSDATVHAHCVLPAQGRYDVEVFAHPTAEGWHEGVAHVGVQSL